MGLKSWLRRRLRTQQKRVAPAFDAGALVFVVIMDAVRPLERGEAYEDPIDAELRASGLGLVSGGGSQLGDLGPKGDRAIAWCGVDVELVSSAVLEDALGLLRAELLRLGAPVGSEVHYTASGERWLDRLGSDGWLLRKPREVLHPAFGC